MRAPLACLIAVLVSAAACRATPNDRTFALHGQVLEVSPDHREALIKHDEVKGFMGAMTMTYKVKNEGLLSGVTPGDLVDATLLVTSNEAYFTAVKRVGTAPIDRAQPDTSVQPAPTASSGFELLKPGEAVPDAQFVDQDGNARRFGAYKGSPVVVTFIYTRCPLPTFCPLMDRHFAALQRTMAGDRTLKDVRLVSISFDPITDTPSVLKRHAQELGADPARWSFLTGDRDEIDRFASRFGVAISRATNDALDITHNLRTAIVSPDQTLVKTYTGNEWTPEQLLTDLRPVARAR
jgi:protein SCO1/2